MAKKIIVIGSGFGGISSAALLARDGHQVTVLEKNSQPGGRSGRLSVGGFHFDMGPSWYMMPEAFDNFFAEFNLKSSDLLDLKMLKPQYRVYFGDGTHLEISGDHKKDRALFESYEKGAGEALDRYLDEGRLKYRLAMDSILYKNQDSLLSFAANKDLILNAHRVGVLEPMESYIKKFFKNHKLQQVLEYNLVFLGCSPSNAPSLFSMMGYVDMELGVWYPQGGLYSVVEAMVRVARDQGVDFKLNQEVQQIVTEGGRVIGVKTKSGLMKADVVVSNADYVHTEDLLSDQTKRNYSKSWWKKRIQAPSAFLLYLGIKGKVPKIKHHTLYFGDNWKDHFSDIFDHPRWPQEPSIYINNPSASDPSLAPKDHQALMVLVPIATGLAEDESWKKLYADYIIGFIERKIGVKIADKIVVKEIFSATDFASRYHSYEGGALGGIAHTFFQSSVFRPANKSKHLHNLFFAGAGTVPGIGVPTAVISGHLIRDRVRKLYDRSSG